MDGDGVDLPGAGDGSDDMCEYIFNPIMRNMRAMERLIQSLRNTQDSSCNDIECIYDNNSNPLQAQTPQPFYTSYWFLIFAWFAFAALLFFFRPASMRQNKNQVKKNVNKSKDPSSSTHCSPRRFYDDDDDNSTIS